MGREANQVTEIFDVKMMLVPDVRDLSKKLTDRLAASLNAIKARTSGQLLAVDSEDTGWTGELALPERQNLDDLVLEVLGVSDVNERRALRAKLYDDITELYRRLRAAEKKMQRYRSMSARKGRVTPQSIADEIWEQLPEKPQIKTVLDFLPPNGTRVIELPAGKVKILKASLFHKDAVQINGITLEFDEPEFCEFLQRVSAAGISGSIRLPKDVDGCRAAIEKSESYTIELSQQFLQSAAAHTNDERIQDRVVQELWKRSAAAHRPLNPGSVQ